MTDERDTPVTSEKSPQKTSAFNSIRQGLLQAIEHAENSVLAVSKQPSSDKLQGPASTTKK